VVTTFLGKRKKTNKKNNNDKELIEVSIFWFSCGRSSVVNSVDLLFYSNNIFLFLKVGHEKCNVRHNNNIVSRILEKTLSFFRKNLPVDCNSAH